MSSHACIGSLRPARLELLGYDRRASAIWFRFLFGMSLENTLLRHIFKPLGWSDHGLYRAADKASRRCSLLPGIHQVISSICRRSGPLGFLPAGTAILSGRRRFWFLQHG